MASLRRIILIQTHLPGVVELLLDGHTNICGTNASGKTTLQRLIPVFYGELPSKVVPKTRKKFDDFYLPQSNSYLVYEYQREEGEVCQVVLTRSAKDGVQYRFVDAPYDKQQLLFQDDKGKVNAYEYDQWLTQLKALGIVSSRKISATSEYRAIIQNDTSGLRGNTSDGIKLRQLAARYALVAPRHKIRHMEKLVSAVHAKEGKMDTLRTMLAAIFEEDGLVQPTTRVKNAKARDWIMQMRQSMRLESLQGEQQNITELAGTLDVSEAQLALLRPLLVDDLQRSITQRADIEAQEGQLKSQLNELKSSFAATQDDLNAQISQADAQLKTCDSQLEHLQSQFDEYQDKDMDQLASDSQSLPLWTEELTQKQQHYRILLEQYGDLEQQLNQQKLSLNESLDRLGQKNRKQIREIEQQRETVRAAQSDKKEQLTEQYQSRRGQLTTDFDEQLNHHRHQLIELQAQINNMGPSTQEQEDLQLSDKRLELAQDHWRSASEKQQRYNMEHQQSRQQQDKAQIALEQARTDLHQVEKKLRLLDLQMNPEQGSLRHFLRGELPGWENTVGKVINQELLDRSDLAPQLSQTDSTSNSDIFGIKLALAEISSPSYAQDEIALQIEKERLENRFGSAKQTQAQCEEALTQAHDNTKQKLELLQQAKRKLDEADNELSFAKESKQRLLSNHQQALSERRTVAQGGLSTAQKQVQELEQQKKKNLHALSDDYHQQMLEFKADWQQEIDLLNQQINELESQIDQKRQSNKEQIKQLEHAFNLELANKDIDPNTLKDLQKGIDFLQRDIDQVRARQEELREYRSFMKVDWQRNRPKYLEQETELKALLQLLNSKLNQHQTAYKEQQQTLEQQRISCHNQLTHFKKLIDALQPLVNKLQELYFRNDLPLINEQNIGDQAERLSRANSALEARSKQARELKDKLNSFESLLMSDAQKQFLDLLQSELSRLDENADPRDKLPIFKDLLQILADQQRQILEQGETIGGDLHKFFTVFSDVNRRISGQGKRLTAAVADDLVLDGINRSEVKIISTVDELNFWGPLKGFADLYMQWRESGKDLPSNDYINALSDVVDLLRSDSSYSIESLLRIELHLNEGGSDLVIKNDRQLLESSSHGMSYLILCKFLLAFTRLLRGEAKLNVHWPIDEIGTLAYHNVEKLFKACDKNDISIVGAFPNPESDVLTLFKHRYLIDKEKKRLQRIEPKISRIALKIAQQQKMEVS